MKFELGTLAVPRLGVAAFRRRIVFHGVFLLLLLATLALALSLLIEEKQRSYQRYEQGFRQSLAEIVTQLRHPAGQLALLNPGRDQAPGQALAPLLLPFSAIDFDEQYKAQRAVEMSGCALQYPDGASLCVAVGSNAYAGGFIYLVGSLDSGPLVGRQRGGLDLSAVHRARVSLRLRGRDDIWIAPFEAMAAGSGEAQRGRLTGFTETGPQLQRQARPQRDFRAWLWREGPCVDPTSTAPDCPRRAFYSIRLPVEAFRQALFQRPQPAWPPADLDRIEVRLQLLAPGDGPALFDSATPGATPPLSLARIGAALQPGETLSIVKLAATPQTIATRSGPEPQASASAWLSRLVRQLPVPTQDMNLQARDQILTPAGRYEVRLSGDLTSLDRGLAARAARLSWLVGAMLAAIAAAWLIIELGLIRRIAVLTKRAAAVSYNMQDPQIDQRIGDLDVSDLRGPDELGILAGSLAELLQRVKDGLRREQLRAEREREMWHAVGHEIMSPLQSLMVLHGSTDDASHRYVQRMQQAVRVLYGTASPGEALASATLELVSLDLDEFLSHVAANAGFAAIENVRYTPLGAPFQVRADEYSLEDAVTHVLGNADRYRPPGTPITLTLSAEADDSAVLHIHNQGPQIAQDMLEKIFEYGVSDLEPESPGQRRGQGLFVAKTYLAKMDGQIRACNVADGVVFELRLRRMQA
ncbi:HAMP domain-containing sensor histidine kinase [Paucibacter sp. PLA-PC-4]|uniref:sensor histidine kinase n=1 Tax=Paucibacter sp. PLA-PC-4 TaxID=2993655 RepID=UPI0022492980|nr:HAMP domain-containing sensor histidine kinase [Paucibacter sp. PLA-PC-4]MCX2862500.1 HAMP domain-containing sensor histidine kinase [Paucibacter sp. PLA-PC-4]